MFRFIAAVAIASAGVLPALAIDPSTADHVTVVPAEGVPGIDTNELRFARLARDDSGSLVLVGAKRDSGFLGVEIGGAYLVSHQDGAWAEVAHLRPHDVPDVRGFGRAVALRGDVAAVAAERDQWATGNPRGAVYVFRRSAGHWTEEAKLVSPTGDGGTSFGFAVALQDDELLVGDPDRAPGGAVFRFRRGPGGWDAGSLVDSGTLPAGGYFGRSIVALADGYVVGAPFSTVVGQADAGLAYVLRDGAGGFGITQTLQAGVPVNGGRFGMRLARHETRVAVRSSGLVDLFDASSPTLVREGPAVPVITDDADQGLELGAGRLYIGVPDADAAQSAGGGVAIYALGGGASATLERILTIPEGPGSAPDPQLGEQIVAGADFVLALAPGADDGVANSGALFGYARNGSTFSPAHRAWPRDGLDDDAFGSRIAADEHWLFVAQPGFDDDVRESGRVLVYRREGAGWRRWQSLAPDHEAAGAQSAFGRALALDGSTVAVAASGGTLSRSTVAVFVLDAGSWRLAQTLVGDAPGDGFGSTVALLADDLLVGREPEAVYAYRRSGGVWSRFQQLQLPGPNRLGGVIATDGRWLYSASYGPISAFARNPAGQFEWRYSIGDYGRSLAAEPGVLLAGEGESVNLYAIGEAGAIRQAQFLIPPALNDHDARVALAPDSIYYAEPTDASVGRVYACPRSGFVVGPCIASPPPRDVAQPQGFGSSLAATPGGLVVAAERGRDASVDAFRPGVVYEYRTESYRDGFE